MFLVKFICALLLVLLLLWGVIARPTWQSSNPNADNTPEVLQARLLQHVKKLSVDFVPRSYEDLNNLNATAAYIKNEFERIGLEALEQPFNASNQTYKNVVASLGPKDQPVIVIGAHYDAHGPLPAADDNASGVAGLIELARLLKDQTLNKHIMLVAYTLEEMPYFGSELMGSFVHAESARKADLNIELMISLEMIGYFTDAPKSQTFPLGILKWFYPTQGNYISVVDQLFSNKGRQVKRGMRQHMHLPMHSINAPTFIPGVDFSDHRNYWAHDFPAVMITDNAFYRNFAYHTPNDTYDQLDYQKMGQVVLGLAGYLTSLTN